MTNNWAEALKMLLYDATMTNDQIDDVIEKLEAKKVRITHRIELDGAPDYLRAVSSKGSLTYRVNDIDKLRFDIEVVVDAGERNVTDLMRVAQHLLKNGYKLTEVGYTIYNHMVFTKNDT